MAIPPLPPASETLGAGIRQAQRRFDERADEVVRAAQAMSSEEPGPDLQRSAEALVGLRQEAIVNQVLFAAFRRQAEVARDAADLAEPR